MSFNDTGDPAPQASILQTFALSCPPQNHHPQPWVLALLLPERTITFLPHNISVGKHPSPSTSPLCALPHPNLTNTQDAGIPPRVFSPYKSIFSLPYVFTSTPHSHGVSAGLWPDLCTGTVLQVCSGWGCEWDGEIPLASLSLQPELRAGSWFHYHTDSVRLTVVGLRWTWPSWRSILVGKRIPIPKN